MQIITVPTTTSRIVNPYLEDVKTLTKATAEYNKNPESDPKLVPAGVFVVPNKDAEKTIFYIQEAAKEQGVTARIVSPQVDAPNSKGNMKRVPVKDVDANGTETGNTTLQFKITAARKDAGQVRGPRTPSETVEAPKPVEPQATTKTTEKASTK